MVVSLMIWISMMMLSIISYIIGYFHVLSGITCMYFQVYVHFEIKLFVLGVWGFFFAIELYQSLIYFEY